MKKNFYLLIIISLFFIQKSYTQSQLISLNNGYSHQSFFSFSNGEVSNVLNDNWDLAFATDPFSTAIRINGGKGVELYNYNLGDTSDWSLINNNVINLLSNPINNSDTSWQIGAFNLHSTGGFDYSWGVYNMATHHVNGDSLFIIKSINGNWKKLWIKSKISGDYLIQYSNLDGSNLISTLIETTNYSNRRFIYFSLDQQTIINREPIIEDWDITFTKYITNVQGMPYSVTGVLTNSGIKSAKVINISDPFNFVDYSSQQFYSEINNIGYDWKYFQMGSGYLIDNSRCYFIKDNNQQVWRMIFNDFEGTSTGNITFNLEQMNISNYENIDFVNTFEVYPNPTSDYINIIYDLENEFKLQICNVQGQIIYSSDLESNSFIQQNLSLSPFESGLYFVKIFDNNNNYLVKKLNVVK